jgi:O-antigen/teichoic acid export membrane protein
VLAGYQIATMLPQKMRMFIKPVLYTLFPRYARKEMSLSQKTLWQSLLVGLALSLAVAAGVVVVVKVLFPDYVDAIPYGLALSGIALFWPANVIGEYYFKARKENSTLKRTMVISRMIYIVILVPAAFVFHVYGVIAALLLEQMVMFYFTLRGVRNE